MKTPKGNDTSIAPAGQFAKSDKRKIVSCREIPSMQITADQWQMFLQTCSDVAQVEGYRPTPSNKPSLLRKTAEAVELLNTVAAEFPQRFCLAARESGNWPVMWIAEISARAEFSRMIETLSATQSRETGPADLAYFKNVCKAVEELTNAAREDIPRFAQYLGPSGWPTMIPIDSGNQRSRQFPAQPEIVSLLSDASSPVFRLYQLGAKNPTKRSLRIDLKSPLNQISGVLYGITQILWHSKRVLEFDCPNHSELDSRIRGAVRLWQERTHSESAAASSVAEVMNSLKADEPRPNTDEAFAVMLKILKWEAGGPGMVRELRPPQFQNHLAPSKRTLNERRMNRFARVLNSEEVESESRTPQQTEDAIRRRAKKTLRDAMNWLLPSHIAP